MNTITSKLATIFGWLYAITVWLALVAVLAWGGAWYGGWPV